MDDIRIRDPKSQNRLPCPGDFGHWNLGFVWDFVLGIWNFEV